MTALALARLLQLGSPALPIGGYSHSQGLESAVEHGVVGNEETVFLWIAALLQYSVGSFELPCLVALDAAWGVPDRERVLELNEEFLATRESAETRAATVQMGFSLRALLCALPDLPAASLDLLRSIDEPSLPCAWSAAARAWQLEPRDSALAYVWSWSENQVLAAIKTLPLGQSAGQRILLRLGPLLARAADAAVLAAWDARSNFTPALGVLCARHETQYSRLFRS